MIFVCVYTAPAKIDEVVYTSINLLFGFLKECRGCSIDFAFRLMQDLEDEFPGLEVIGLSLCKFLFHLYWKIYCAFAHHYYFFRNLILENALIQSR